MMQLSGALNKYIDTSITIYNHNIYIYIYIYTYIMCTDVCEPPVFTATSCNINGHSSKSAKACEETTHVFQSVSGPIMCESSTDFRTDALVDTSIIISFTTITIIIINTFAR